VIAREALEVFPHNTSTAVCCRSASTTTSLPAPIIGIILQATAHVEGVARERPSIVRVAAFADSAVIYEVKYFTRDIRCVTASTPTSRRPSVRPAPQRHLLRNGPSFLRSLHSAEAGALRSPPPRSPSA